MANYYAHWQQNFWLDTFWPEEHWYSDDATYAGSVSVTLDNLSPALVGSAAEPGAVDGFIAASLGPLTASLPGSTATTILFDLPVNVSVNWQIQDLAAVSGTIAPTLDDLAGALSGIAWDLSYTDGRIESQPLFWPTLFWGDLWNPEFWLTSPNLEGVTGALSGTLAAPGTYTGPLTAVLGGDTALALGATYLPANYNGLIAATLGDLTSVMSGAITDPIQTGSVAATLDGMTGLIQAKFVSAGSFIGHMHADVGDLRAQNIYGQVFIVPRFGLIEAGLGYLSGDVRGLSLPEGAQWGPLRSTLTGVGALMEGTNVAPRMREKALQPTVTEIDWKTLCDQHNLTAEGDYDYEFSNGRRFKQG